MTNSNVLSLEQDIKALFNTATADRPKDDTHLEIGKLTAESIKQDYQATAEYLSVVGNRLTEIAERTEAYMKEIKDLIAHVHSEADRLKARGEAMAEHIEHSSKTTANVRSEISSMMEKIATASILNAN